LRPEYGFLGSLMGTVVMLAGAAFTGRARRIRAHVGFVAAAVTGLAIAIYFALQVGQLYDLEKAGMITPIHLTLARVTTASFLWPLLTGPLAARKMVSPRVHRLGAWIALILTLASTVTGMMMLYGAERLA
jgi:hypothetical protein